MHDLVDPEHSARPSYGRWPPRASTLALAMACVVATACANPAADTGSAGSTGSTGSTDSTGETSAPTTSTTSAPTTSTTDGPECTVPADCPGLDDACQIRTCEDGKCGRTVIESGKISLGGPPAVILASDPLDVHRYVVVATDLNGDDRSDLVVTGNTLLQTVSVLLGNGDGTFAARVDYPTRVGPDVLGCQDGMESSAVADALGVRMKRMPITAEKLALEISGIKSEAVKGKTMGLCFMGEADKYKFGTAPTARPRKTP